MFIVTANKRTLYAFTLTDVDRMNDVTNVRLATLEEQAAVIAQMKAAGIAVPAEYDPDASNLERVYALSGWRFGPSIAEVRAAQASTKQLFGNAVIFRTRMIKEALS